MIIPKFERSITQRTITPKRTITISNVCYWENFRSKYQTSVIPRHVNNELI
jgi:hypothetical protein